VTGYRADPVSRCLLLALSGHRSTSDLCLLSGQTGHRFQLRAQERQSLAPRYSRSIFLEGNFLRLHVNVVPCPS
jgi:hypothetical protein